MKKYFKIYIFFIKSSFALFLAHRFDFFMSALANFLWTFGQLISIKFIFSKVGQFEGWNFNDVLVLLAFGQFHVYLSSVIYANNHLKVWDKILDGTLDRLFIKPINIKFYLSFERLSLAQVIPMLVTVLPLLIYGLTGTTFSFLNLFFSFLILFLGLILMFIISLIFAGLNFFIEDSRPIRETLVTSYEQTTRVPLNLFPTFVKYTMILIIPVAFVAYFPVKVLKNDSNFFLVVFIEVCLIIFFALLNKFVWDQGLKKYTGIG